MSASNASPAARPRASPIRPIEGVADTIKAETCDECRTYVKIMYQRKDSELEPVADDVASLGLDLLVTEAGWRRAGVNPFLLGY